MASQGDYEMKIEKTERGFELINFQDHNDASCSLQQSSAVGDYGDAFERPGSSFVWLGAPIRMHLSREQVAELVQHLQQWLVTGSFQVEVPG